VQQLANDVVLDVLITLRWQAIEADNDAFDRTKNESRTYRPEMLSNGDTRKQRLVRSRYLLFKLPPL
jgi:hypothetical protein